MLLLSAAISVYDFPKKGFNSPTSSLGRLLVSSFLFSIIGSHSFQSNRLGCQGLRYLSCSGNLVESPAWLNASSASIAEAVWCPCPPSPVIGKRVIITLGRNLRIIQTTSESILSFPQKAKVSSGDLEKPKSYARLKNCSAPSIFRASRSSCVRISPNNSPCSEPIRFCPPSPRVMERYPVCNNFSDEKNESRAVFSSSG